jgi:hypothetical protein
MITDPMTTGYSAMCEFFIDVLAVMVALRLYDVYLEWELKRRYGG